MRYILSSILLLMFTSVNSQSVTKYNNVSREDFIKSTFNLQNKSFLNDEKAGDIDTSIHYATLALFNWIEINDTINEANIRKYLGYLYGKKGLYENGKSEIFRAINLFTLKKYEQGIAVSYFDLSKVYGYEKRYDSSLLYADKALNYWQQKADTFRILTSYNQKLYLLIQTQRYDEAKILQEESSMLLVNKKLHWRPKIDFYYLSMTFYVILKYIIQEKYYEQLYTELKSKLKRKGIKYEYQF